MLERTVEMEEGIREISSAPIQDGVSACEALELIVNFIDDHSLVESHHQECRYLLSFFDNGIETPEDADFAEDLCETLFASSSVCARSKKAVAIFLSLVEPLRELDGISSFRAATLRMRYDLVFDYIAEDLAIGAAQYARSVVFE